MDIKTLCKLVKKNKQKDSSHDSEIENKVNYLTSLWELGFEKKSWRVIDALSHFLFYEGLEHPKVHLMYICSLFQNGLTRTAKEGLKEYIKKYNLQYITGYLPACYLAREIGIKDDLILKGAAIFEHMEANRKTQTFENYVKGKSIAIVGNSPEILEKENGTIIDSRDIVFRMNTFRISKKHTGEKTNVYLWCGTQEVLEHENIKNYKKYNFIIFSISIWHIDLNNHTNTKIMLDVLYNIIQNSNCHIIYFPADVWYHLKLESELKIPTTGLNIIYYLYKIRGTIDIDEIFGFNTQTKEKGHHKNIYKTGPLDSYFDYFNTGIESSLYKKNVRVIDSYHNLNEELRFRNSLLTNSTTCIEKV